MHILWYFSLTLNLFLIFLYKGNGRSRKCIQYCSTRVKMKKRRMLRVCNNLIYLKHPISRSDLIDEQ